MNPAASALVPLDTVESGLLRGPAAFGVARRSHGERRPGTFRAASGAELEKSAVESVLSPLAPS